MKPSSMASRHSGERKSDDSKKKYVWLLAIVLLSGTAIAAWKMGSGEKADVSPNMPIGRTPLDNLPPTLASTLFSGRAIEAYAIAAQMPDLLAQIYCYCQCNMDSLLICYTNDHAANCDECQGEAFMVRDLFKKGYTIDQIRQKIHEKFG